MLYPDKLRAPGSFSRSIWPTPHGEKPVECDLIDIKPTNHKSQYAAAGASCTAGKFIMEKQVVEYAGIPVGISVADGDRIKFIAVKFPVIDLDGGTYKSLEDLQRAIHVHMQSSREDSQAFAAGRAPGGSATGSAFNVA